MSEPTPFWKKAVSLGGALTMMGIGAVLAGLLTPLGQMIWDKQTAIVVQHTTMPVHYPTELKTLAANYSEAGPYEPGPTVEVDAKLWLKLPLAVHEQLSDAMRAAERAAEDAIEKKKSEVRDAGRQIAEVLRNRVHYHSISISNNGETPLEDVYIVLSSELEGNVTDAGGVSTAVRGSKFELGSLRVGENKLLQGWTAYELHEPVSWGHKTASGLAASAEKETTPMWPLLVALLNVLLVVVNLSALLARVVSGK